MDEREYKVGERDKQNHFNRRKINGKWHYWREDKTYAEGKLHNLTRTTGIMTPNDDMAASNPKYSTGGVYKNNCIRRAPAYQ